MKTHLILIPVSQTRQDRRRLASKRLSVNAYQFVRGTVLVPNSRDFPATFERLKKESESRGWTISAFDNKMGGNSYGYRDFKVSLRSPDGHECELQFNTTSMFIAKENGQTSHGEGGHKLFEKARPIIEKAKAEHRGLTEEEMKIVKPLEMESRHLYTGAHMKAFNYKPLYAADK